MPEKQGRGGGEKKQTDRKFLSSADITPKPRRVGIVPLPRRYRTRGR